MSFSGSSSHRGGQPNMLIGLTELHLWETRQSSPNCAPDDFAQLKIDHFRVCGCFEINLVA
jgi:hypothetical protein